MLVDKERFALRPIDEVTKRLSLSPEERGAVERLLLAAASLAQAAGFTMDDEACLGLGAHLGHLLRRLASGEKVTGVDAAMFEEVPLEFRTMAAQLLQPLFDQVAQPLDPVEAGLVALHFGAARERTELSA
jgi:hypothetical protein